MLVYLECTALGLGRLGTHTRNCEPVRDKDVSNRHCPVRSHCFLERSETSQAKDRGFVKRNDSRVDIQTLD